MSRTLELALITIMSAIVPACDTTEASPVPEHDVQPEAVAPSVPAARIEVAITYCIP